MNSDSCDCHTTQLPSGHQAVVAVWRTESHGFIICAGYIYKIHVCKPFTHFNNSYKGFKSQYSYTPCSET